MSKVNFEHKEWCPYCRGETYDDECGHCTACGGPRGREKNEPKKETKANYEEFQPYFIGPQPYFTDGGIPQETEDERVKRVLEWTERCNEEEARQMREIHWRENEMLERQKKINEIIIKILIMAFAIIMITICFASGGLNWLSLAVR